MTERFRAKLEGPVQGGYYLTVGKPVAKKLGRTALTPVRGRINGTPYRSSMMPRGDGTFYMVLNEELRREAGIHGAETVAVEMEIDTEAREVDVPDDLQSALDRNKQARLAWDGFPSSHRKDYVDWITEAKRAETRTRRLTKAVEMIAKGKPQR